MGSFLDRFKQSFNQWMQGRAGFDELSRALLIAAVVLLVLDMVTGLGVFSLLGLVCLVVCVARALSRDTYRRAQECEAARKALAKPKRWATLAKKNWTDRKTKRYFTCPGCGCILSVPVGKGTLRVTCPRCHTQTTHKS